MPCRDDNISLCAASTLPLVTAYLVHLAPTVLDARNIPEHGAVFPEGTFLYVVDEPDGRKIHVQLALHLDSFGLGNIPEFWSTHHGAFKGHSLVFRDWAGELCRAKYIWKERVIIETPYSMRPGWFQGVCKDKLSYNLEVSVG